MHLRWGEIYNYTLILYTVKLNKLKIIVMRHGIKYVTLSIYQHLKTWHNRMILGLLVTRRD